VLRAAIDGCGGSVALLRHAVPLDDDAAVAALRAGGFRGPAVGRIWVRRATNLSGAPGCTKSDQKRETKRSEGAENLTRPPAPGLSGPSEGIA
jgi:hypothetical protein